MIILCHTAADAKITKPHVENVQAQIEKNKNNKCIVQTHFDLKNIPEKTERTNGPVNAHLIYWRSKAQNIQNLENIW